MIQRRYYNVSEIAQAYLCCSCGLCEVVCPENAIKLIETPGGHFFPVVSQNLCTGCGICVATCAGVNLSIGLPENPFKGTALQCWVGKATDEQVYRRSQSGGGVTAILLALMEAGRIKGAATVNMEAGAPPRPVVRIARSQDEILSARGSKYCPVPLLHFLRELDDNNGPIAMVGLGCHVHGLHNAFKHSPELRGKVGPVIGLICDRVLTRSAIDYLLWRSGVKIGEQASFEFRSKEWRGSPGDVRIGIKGRETVFLPSRERMQIKDYFTPARCRLCFDKMNVFADITAGDPWGIPGTDKKQGETALVGRTTEGLEVVHMAVEKGHLDLRESTYDLITDGQAIEQKKRDFSGYCRAWRSMSLPLPDQSDLALDATKETVNTSDHEKQLRHALTLDQFPSNKSMLRDARRWTAKQRFSRKIKKLFCR